ncbi:MAG: ABC transporter ATP-binding protein [Spirochaetales bacterium]|nr:ABC transporter ATP-binding protein [Spirochaetales bacterium]
MAVSDTVVLETRNISKRFPRVLANNNINIKLHEGEIISLLGENGAGKSTLMNVLYGLYRPTTGTILLNGKEVEFSSPRDAINQGLGMVHQHFMLVDPLTVTENIILGMEPGKGGMIDYKTARREVQELSDRYKLEIDPDSKVEDLPVGLQQRVEILKALYRKAQILILDEPTAVLTPGEVDDLFEVIMRLRDSGVSVIIITHKLEEVRAISDRVYILRRGEIAGERATKDCSKTDLANLMVGRDVVLTVEKEEHKPGDSASFEIKDLTVINDRQVKVIDGLSLNVKPGEIVGIAGVDGNGQTELAETIMGQMGLESGDILFKGEPIQALTTKARRNLGISYVPTDRQKAGLVLPFSIAENMILGSQDEAPFTKGINLQQRPINDYSDKLVKDYDVRCSTIHEAVGNLSGGNQQKVILAREFDREPEFLLVSQPTRGLDVGAIEYIHKQILGMRQKNSAVLLISLELEEIFSLADRILVLFEGKIIKELIPAETNEKEVGLYMTGGK